MKALSHSPTLSLSHSPTLPVSVPAQVDPHVLMSQADADVTYTHRVPMHWPLASEIPSLWQGLLVPVGAGRPPWLVHEGGDDCLAAEGG